MTELKFPEDITEAMNEKIMLLDLVEAIGQAMGHAEKAEALQEAIMFQAGPKMKEAFKDISDQQLACTGFIFSLLIGLGKKLDLTNDQINSVIEYTLNLSDVLMDAQRKKTTQ